MDDKTADKAPSDVSRTPGDSDLEDAAHVDEKALMRKIDMRLLPGVTLLYLMSFLDRSNVSNARIEGLTDDTNMTGNQYLTGLTLFFIGYVLFEIPCNVVLKRTTPRFWLPTLTIVFGIVATLLGVVQSMEGFFVARFALGVAECGIFPGVVSINRHIGSWRSGLTDTQVFYFSLWYQRKERQFRIALFFSAAAFAGAFGGILAFGIAKMDEVGGLSGWRWIFILEGILTVLVGASAYLFITNYPATSKFLTPSENRAAEHRLAIDSDSAGEEQFSWHNALQAAKDPKCWLYAGGFHFMSLPLYTLSLFMPTIIRDLGYSSARAQLLTIPPYAFATMLTVLTAWHSERQGRRAPYLCASALLAAIGYCILLGNTDPTARPGMSYAGTFIAAAGIYPATGLVLSWPAVNVGGQTKRAVANALQISIGNCGAVIGTQLYRTEDSPRYIVGHSVALAYTIMSASLTLFTWWYLTRENKKKDVVQPGDGVVGGAGGLRGDDDPKWRFML